MICKYCGHEMIFIESHVVPAVAPRPIINSAECPHCGAFYSHWVQSYDSDDIEDVDTETWTPPSKSDNQP